MLSGGAENPTPLIARLLASLPPPVKTISSGEAPISAGDRISRRDANLDRFSGAVLDGVGEKVGDHLIEAKPIPSAVDRLLRSCRPLPVPFTTSDSEQPAETEIVLEPLGHRLGHRDQIDVLQPELQLSGGGAADVEQRIDQLGEPSDLLVDPLDPRGELGQIGGARSALAVMRRIPSTFSRRLVSGVFSSWLAIDRNSSRSFTAARASL